MAVTDMVQQVYEAGIVGSGGAGFPTHVKLKATGVDVYLINGAECEPLLEVDQHLMKVEAKKMVEAGKAVSRALGGARLVFCLKKKYTESIEALRSAGGEVLPLRDFYPLGDEVVLIYEALGRVVPEGKIPLDVGVVVNNPETLLNIYEAMQKRPVTHTFMSVGGAVENPGIYRVPLGSNASDLIKVCGGVTIDNPVYIDGGPMMGKYMEDVSFPVKKTSKAILVLSEDSALVRYETMPVKQMLKRARISCCQCNQCTLVCSRNLIGFRIEPHKIMRAMAYGQMQNIDTLKMALLCSECNLCSGLHACPMGLSPRRVNQEIKKALRKEGVRPEFDARELNANSMRDYRLLPSSRLKKRLDLEKYDMHSPYMGDLPVSEVTILMSQHIGAPAIPCVKDGDMVVEGQLIGKPPEGALGALIHASITGRVSDVNAQSIKILAEQEEI